MNMNENLQFSFGFLLVWIVAYVLLRWLRPEAKRSHEVAVDLIAGSTVNSAFWLALLFAATYMQNANESFLSILNFVLDTRIIFVPWVYLSYALVAFGFQLNRVSRGHVDWRVALTLIVICLTVVFSVYYYLVGIFTTPFSFP